MTTLLNALNQSLGIVTQEQRVDMERHYAVRTALELLTRDIDLPRETVRTHVAQMLLDSCVKQARWSA